MAFALGSPGLHVSSPVLPVNSLRVGFLQRTKRLEGNPVIAAIFIEAVHLEEPMHIKNGDLILGMHDLDQIMAGPVDLAIQQEG